LALDHPEGFDCVVSFEVLEHVSDPNAFLASISKLVKPNGAVVLSTLNRTLKSLAFGIFALALYAIFKFLPLNMALIVLAVALFFAKKHFAGGVCNIKKDLTG